MLRRQFLFEVSRIGLVPLSQVRGHHAGAGPLVLAVSDLVHVKARLASFFERIVVLSRQSPPPGVNAANGYFREGVRNDPTLARLRSPIRTISPGGKLCADLAGGVFQTCFDGFAPENHSASGLTYMPLAAQMLSNALPQIAVAVATVVGVVYTGGTATAVAASILKGVKSVADEVSKRGFVSSGTHMNGWVSVGVRDRAAALRNAIDANFIPKLNAKGKKFCRIIKAVADDMTKLPTGGHDPWLRADWQIGFAAICAAGAKALRA